MLLLPWSRRAPPAVDCAAGSRLERNPHLAVQSPHSGLFPRVSRGVIDDYRVRLTPSWVDLAEVDHQRAEFPVRKRPTRVLVEPRSATMRPIVMIYLLDPDPPGWAGQWRPSPGPSLGRARSGSHLTRRPPRGPSVGSGSRSPRPRGRAALVMGRSRSADHALSMLRRHRRAASSSSS